MTGPTISAIIHDRATKLLALAHDADELGFSHRTRDDAGLLKNALDQLDSATLSLLMALCDERVRINVSRQPSPAVNIAAALEDCPPPPGWIGGE